MIEIIVLVSAVFWVGAIGALWVRYWMAQHWRAKAIARRKALGISDDDEFLRPCGFVCQECIKEGYPKEFCGWFL